MPNDLYLPPPDRTPDFDNLLAVLRRECPARPTLCELFLNERLYNRFGSTAVNKTTPSDIAGFVRRIEAFRRTGYDYCSIVMPDFEFKAGAINHLQTRSLNEGAVIFDRSSFSRYEWPDPGTLETGFLDRIASYLPKGMKLVLLAPGGLLENVIRLTGYESLCFMIQDDEQLAYDIFERVGRVLVDYYETIMPHETIGAAFGNDDWGFKSQTMLSPADMRKFVFPWHRKIVETCHANGKPAILHSCGCLSAVMDDVIDDIRYDGKHSFEDTIQPVEEAYKQYHGRIAIIGGIDVDFICRSTAEKIHARASAMLALAASTGGYALGTGNSVPEYIPDANFLAMIHAAFDPGM